MTELTLVESLRYGAQCPVSSPGGDVAKDMLAAADEIERLMLRLSEAEQDAARYRWLRALVGQVQPMFPLAGEAKPKVSVRFPDGRDRRNGALEWSIAESGEQLDTKIDAAMKGPK